MVLDMEDASGLQIAWVGGDLATELPVCALPREFPNIGDNAYLIAMAPNMRELLVTVLDNAVEGRYGGKEVTLDDETWTSLEKVLDYIEGVPSSTADSSSDGADRRETADREA
jgi:hypothetical protein